MPAEIDSKEVLTWALLALSAAGGFLWALANGQFEDLDRAARLPLDEDSGQATDEKFGSPGE